MTSSSVPVCLSEVFGGLSETRSEDYQGAVKGVYLKGIFEPQTIALTKARFASSWLSAPSVAIFLRSRFSDAGEKWQRSFGP